MSHIPDDFDDFDPDHFQGYVRINSSLPGAPIYTPVRKSPVWNHESSIHNIEKLAKHLRNERRLSTGPHFGDMLAQFPLDYS